MRNKTIDPDEIFLDSRNIPDYDTHQFEGRIEKPISKIYLFSLAGFFSLIVVLFLVQAANLQISKGQELSARSEKNTLRSIPIFAPRGVVFDKNGIELAWNTPDIHIEPNATSSLGNDDNVAHRQYIDKLGFAHLLGYVQYPSKDKNGFYYREDFEGVDGVEKYYDSKLKGKNGSKLAEVDALGHVISGGIVQNPDPGNNIYLSIDSRLQASLYKSIQEVSDRDAFSGGAGIIMDASNGQILAAVSYPEYDEQVMADRTDSAKIKSMLADNRMLFLNRARDGLYAPGSTIKPFLAVAALNENIINPDDVIVTTGSISIPNPYDSSKSTIFRDWKNHGSIDMRKALSVSSDVYFYIIGGGYKDTKGLGISRIDKYLNLFGFGQNIPNSFFSNKTGTIPTPEWKKKTFNEEWYVGNTYHTSIGQYGTLVTPIQMLRAVTAIANDGTLIVPQILKDAKIQVEKSIDINSQYFKVVREGMRMGVVEGTVTHVRVPYIEVAAKTGTAEIGSSREKVNSWISGFWPYEDPKYTFVITLENGSVESQSAAAVAMRQELDWMSSNTPEYFNK